MLISLLLIIVSAIAIVFLWTRIRSGSSERHLGSWVFECLLQSAKRKTADKLTSNKQHVLFCMVDHFEPVAAGSTIEEEQHRMQDWLIRYPALATRHRDSDGKPPQHTWFYPGENYRPEYLDNLVVLCRQGLGEIELHLHHGHDTSESLREKIKCAIANFSKHGALVTQSVPPKHVYGFIHGNMALDNSMKNAALCGVNDEITVLRETGCYADFSMPTAPAVSQTRKINAIYYAQDDPARAKSHNSGVDVAVHGRTTGDLMIIQGPLALDWLRRKFGFAPKVENGEIQVSNPPSYERIKTWIAQHIHVKGRPEWVIVKVSCHGAEDRSRDAILGEAADSMYAALETYRDRPDYALHYVTARELYNIIKAAEAGLTGDPGQYRNYAIGPYQTHASHMLLNPGIVAAQQV